MIETQQYRLMAIVNAQTTKDFRATHRYVAVREDKPPQIVHTSTPGCFNALLGQPINPLVVAAAMEARAAKSDRVEKPCYHISISVAQADELASRADWNQLAVSFLEKAGLEECQSVAYLHEDTTYPDSDEVRPHLHLVVNRVKSDGTAAPTSWDYYRFQSAIRDVEQEMGLTAEPNSWEVDRCRDSSGQVHRLAAEQAQYEDPKHPRAEPPQPTVKSQLQEVLDEAIEQASSVEAITDALAQQGIDVQVSDRGWSLEKDGIAFAGSQLGRAYSMTAIEQTLGTTAERPQPNVEVKPSSEEITAESSQSVEERRQQQRVETLAPVLRQMLLHSRGTQRQEGVELLDIGEHRLAWRQRDSKLGIYHSETKELILMAQRDSNNHWHDKGSKLTVDHVEHFQAAARQEAARQARRARPQRRRPREL